MTKLHTIYTARVSYMGHDGADISVQGGDLEWKPLAPTWEMVKSYKAGRLSEEAYSALYIERLRLVPMSTWESFMSKDARTLMCYCKDGDFCHRDLLVRFLKKTFGNRIHYGGFRK